MDIGSIVDSAEQQYVDGITLLTAHASESVRTLTKVWLADGLILNVPRVTWFQARQARLQDFQSLVSLLRHLTTQTETAAIRGILRPGVDPNYCYRRIRQEEGHEPSLSDAPHHWFCIDVDKLPIPFPHSLGGLEALAGAIRALMPAPLSTARCAVQFSSSAGHSSRHGKVSAHLWFWNEAACLGSKVKQWVKEQQCSVKIDTSTLSGAQIHFTANPVIVGGTDPIPDRIVVLEGGDLSLDFKTNVIEYQPHMVVTTRAINEGIFTTFTALVERSGVLRSKTGVADRPLRLAYLDILVREFGIDPAPEELRPYFYHACVGAGDSDAESDFNEAMRWVERPATERLGAASVMRLLDEWSQVTDDTYATVDIASVRHALAENHARSRAQAQLREAAALVLPKPAAEAHADGSNIVTLFPTDGSAALNVEIEEPTPTLDPRALLFPIIQESPTRWAVKFVGSVPAYFGNNDHQIQLITENIFLLLAKNRTAVRLNKWTQEIEIAHESGDCVSINDGIIIDLWASARNNDTRWNQLNLSFVRDIIYALANKNSYDPIELYFENLKVAKIWASPDVTLDSWLPRVMRVDDTPYHRAVGRYLVGSMVRRLLDPGCKSDEVVVMCSEQGYDKSSICRALAPWPESFVDNLPLGSDAREILETANDKIVVELAEMATSKRADIEKIRRMVSAVSDKARPAYGHYTTERKRRFIFIGTSNNTKPLKDQDGNRRFLPIVLRSPIDLELFLTMKDRLIRLAYDEWTATKTTFRLPRELWAEAAKHQERGTDRGSFHEIIVERLGEVACHGLEVISGVDILDYARKEHRTSNAILARCMESIGFRRERVMVEGRHARYWIRRAPWLPGAKQITVSATNGMFIEGDLQNPEKWYLTDVAE